MSGINLNKSYDFFQPEANDVRIHIIGCGSVGSTVAENLARMGVTKMTLWDFDIVESQNIVNQMFRQTDIGKSKVDALKDLILEINPSAERDIILEPRGWRGKVLSGIILLAVDSIDVRKNIVKKHTENPHVKAVFDVRTMLTGAQAYGADWGKDDHKKDLVNSMEFTEEEARESTPVSACGTVLGVATTVRLISAYCSNNIIKFLKGEDVWKLVIMDGFSGMLVTM